MINMSCKLLNSGRDYHCGLIGYQVKKKPRETQPPQDSSPFLPHGGKTKPVTLNQNSPAIANLKASTAGKAFQS